MIGGILPNGGLQILARAAAENFIRGVLSVAKKAIKRGIYAVEKDGMAQMKKETCSNKAELEKAVAEYEEKGFKVYYNEQ